MDMWPAFIDSVTRHLPEAGIIYDKFHIVKNLNKALSDLRINLYREEKDLNKRAVLKGTRWILMKNQKNLSDKRDEKSKLEEALAVNKPLSIAYYLSNSPGKSANNKQRNLRKLSTNYGNIYLTF